MGALEAVGTIEDQEKEQNDEDGLPSIGTAGRLNPTTPTVPAVAVAPPMPAYPPSLPAASPAEKSGSEPADNLADIHQVSGHQDRLCNNLANDTDKVEDTIHVEPRVTQPQQSRHLPIPERHPTSNSERQTRRSTRLANKPAHDYSRLQERGFARVARCQDAEPTTYNHATDSTEHVERKDQWMTSITH